MSATTTRGSIEMPTPLATVRAMASLLAISIHGAAAMPWASHSASVACRVPEPGSRKIQFCAPSACAVTARRESVVFAAFAAFPVFAALAATTIASGSAFHSLTSMRSSSTRPSTSARSMRHSSNCSHTHCVLPTVTRGTTAG
jgi:hypothetical protein